MDKIGYLGPEGSYSYLAAEAFRPNYEKVAFRSFRLAVQALKGGECGLIVLPVENSLNGCVNQNLDLLQSTEGITAFEERIISIDHRLATRRGADISRITRIFSHSQALEQCGEYLAAHFPEAELIATPSTSASLKMILSDGDAGIVGAHTHAEGITLSKENIADEKSNFTQFLLIKKGVPEETTQSKRIYFSAVCLHEPGMLVKLLSKLDGLNMTKINSRPIKGRAGEYRFFIEVEGNYSDRIVKTALNKVKNSCLSFKILGLY